MKRRLITAALCLAAVFPAGRAVAIPPIVDLPGSLSSSNVHMVARFPTGEGIGGKFAKIGGKLYYFQTTGKLGAVPGGGYGYQNGLDGGVWAFDASNPEDPQLVGHFPIPFWENEDVDLSANRGLLFFTADNRPQWPGVPVVGPSACGIPASTDDAWGFAGVDAPAGAPSADQSQAIHPVSCKRQPAILFTVDISNPSQMKLIGTPFVLPENEGLRPNGKAKRSAGHTATCIMDCNYVLISASANNAQMVVDMRDPASPKVAGYFATPAAADNWYYQPGTTHDVNLDRYGNLWTVGSGGTAMFQLTKDPLHPKLLAKTPDAIARSKDGSTLDQTKTTNQLIHHGAGRLDKNTVVVGEEWFPADGACGAAKGQHAESDGRLQTWGIDTKHKSLKLLNMWDTELQGMIQEGEVEAGLGIGCSSHWFDIGANKVLANGWYEQGVRFFDLSNPRKIRQIGYYIDTNAAASQAQFVPGRPDLVYVADYSLGMYVVKIDNAGKGAHTTIAPVRAEWLKGYKGRNKIPTMSPDPDFGWACMRPAF